MPACLAACVGEKQNVVLDTFLKGIENTNSIIDKAPINPNYRYLKVEANGQPALLVLGYQDRSLNGITDIWYSSFKEVIQINGGRLIGTQGLDQPIDKPEREKLVFKLNRFLGGDIAISEILPVADQAHARFSAISRTYRYSIAREKNPFRRDYTHYFYGTIDDSLMNQGAALIMCYEDFTSFSKVDTDTKTNICRISAAKWTTEGSELVFTITADRFLRNMVRAIVGTLLELGTGKISLPGLKGIIEGNNRSDAGDSAPAKGLSLVRIVYPGEVFISERVDG